LKLGGRSWREEQEQKQVVVEWEPWLWECFREKIRRRRRKENRWEARGIRILFEVEAVNVAVREKYQVLVHQAPFAVAVASL
jgi:hypothetical protein